MIGSHKLAVPKDHYISTRSRETEHARRASVGCVLEARDGVCAICACAGACAGASGGHILRFQVWDKRRASHISSSETIHHLRLQSIHLILQVVEFAMGYLLAIARVPCKVFKSNVFTTGITLLHFPFSPHLKKIFALRGRGLLEGFGFACGTVAFFCMRVASVAKYKISRSTQLYWED